MIKITRQGFSEFQDFIKALPRGVRIAAMRAISFYLVGDERHGLHHEPTWKFVSRARAYGKVSDAPAGYFSWAQFRFVAAITEGFTKIPYERTGKISGGWTFNERNSDWAMVSISNDVPGAEYVVGKKQSRHEALVGWRKWPDVVASNMRGAIRAGQAAVNKWIRERQRQ